MDNETDRHLLPFPEQNSLIERENKYLQAKARVRSIEKSTSRPGKSNNAFDRESTPLEPDTVALLESDLCDLADGFKIEDHYQETVKDFIRVSNFRDIHGRGETHSDAEQAAIRVISENLSAIQSGIPRDNLEEACETLQLLSQLMQSREPEIRKKGVEAILKEREVLLEVMKSKDERSLTVELIQMVFVSGSENQVNEMKQIVNEGLVTGDSEYQSTFLANLLESKNKHSRFAEELVADVLSSKFGVNGRRCVTEWIDTSGREPRRFIQQNILSMERIEKERPGACKTLWEEFGIVNFNRYPEDILIKQVEERDKPGDYGIVLYPRADHNGAFHDKEIDDEDYMHKIVAQTEGNYPLRIYECGNKRELVESLIKSNRRYGQISFAVIAGHGTDQSVQLGNYRGNTRSKDTGTTGDHLYAVDIVDYIAYEGWENEPRPIAKKLSRFFVENPTIILSSCSTAKGNENIAQKMSMLGATVIAPDDVSYGIGDVVVDNTNNRLNFDVRYNRTNTKVYRDGIEIVGN